MTKDELINKTLLSARSIETEQDLNNFFQEMACLSIAALRGMNGNQFVDDFLAAARNDEMPLIITPARVQ